MWIINRRFTALSKFNRSSALKQTRLYHSHVTADQVVSTLSVPRFLEVFLDFSEFGVDNVLPFFLLR